MSDATAIPEEVTEKKGWTSIAIRVELLGFIAELAEREKIPPTRYLENVIRDHITGKFK